MRTTTKGALRRTAAVAVIAGLGTLTVGIAPAAAETTATQAVAVDLGDLDTPGTGSFAQFDPALGTLTGVTIEADVSMSFDVCTTNNSSEASSLPAGSASGEAVLTFAGGVVATANGSMTVPAVELLASDQGDDCAAFVASGTAPGSPDSRLESQSGIVEQFSTTITDPAQLAPYIGTGTVDFNWTASSTSDISQPSEWTIAFLASGSGEARVSYEYTTEELPPAPPEPPAPPVDQPPATATELPATGGPSPWPVALAGLFLVAGAALISTRRFTVR